MKKLLVLLALIGAHDGADRVLELVDPTPLKQPGDGDERAPRLELAAD